MMAVRTLLMALLIDNFPDSGCGNCKSVDSSSSVFPIWINFRILFVIKWDLLLTIIYSANGMAGGSRILQSSLAVGGWMLITREGTETVLPFNICALICPIYINSLMCNSMYVN